MPCENYREALTGVAAANAAPSSELRSHLDACASCRAAFTEEMQLFAAIDTGLQATANAEVPASLLPRVRARLMEQPVSRRSWIPAFAGIAVAAALVVAIVLAHKLGSGGTESNPQLISAARDVPPTAIQPSHPAVVRLEAAGLAGKHRQSQAVKTAHVGVPAREEVAVLIPAGQKLAIDALLVSIQRGEVKAEVLLAEKPLQELEVSPLSISPIEMKPLVDASAEPASLNEKTRR